MQKFGPGRGASLKISLKLLLLPLPLLVAASEISQKPSKIRRFLICDRL